MLGALFGKLIELSGFARSHRRRASAAPPAAARAMLGIVARLRAAHVRRRLGVRRRLRRLSVRRRAVPRSRHPQAADPGDDRARRVHVHDGRAARQPADPEHHPDDVLRHHDDGRADARADRRRCSSWSSGMLYLDWRRRAAALGGEGYGTGHSNEPERGRGATRSSHRLLAFLPLAVVAVDEHRVHRADPAVVRRDGDAGADAGGAPLVLDVSRQVGVWAVEGRWCSASAPWWSFAWPRVSASLRRRRARRRSPAACWRRSTPPRSIGFGAVIAALPGFVAIQAALEGDPRIRW